MMLSDDKNRCYQLYQNTIRALRYAAYRCGYALAVHGSLKRDVDLIAVPWRDSAVSAHSLISNLIEVIKAICGGAQPVGEVCKRPCGRLGWAIRLPYDMEGPYFDISVMPRDGRHESE